MLETFTLPDGREIRHHLRRQDGDGRPVVLFLNGLSQTTVAWGLQARALVGRRDVLLVDCAGQGRSTPPHDVHRPEGHAKDLLQLLDALGLERVDLVGFSFGGRVALRIALQDPGRVRRMVLAGCAHRETTVRRWIVQGWLDALERGGREHAFQVVTPAVMGEEWLAKHEHMRANLLKAFLRRNTPEGMQRLLADSVLPGGDLTDELRALAQPTLVVRGEHDLVVPDWLSHELAELLPDASYAECPRVGHSVPIEAPAWFSDQLAAHLDAGD